MSDPCEVLLQLSSQQHEAHTAMLMLAIKVMGAVIGALAAYVARCHAVHLKHLRTWAAGQSHHSGDE